MKKPKKLVSKARAAAESAADATRAVVLEAFKRVKAARARATKRGK